MRRNANAAGGGHVRAKKQYGQNFLIDEGILDEIVEGAGITGEEIVVEIGPGLGSLTKRLCGQAGFVLAVEIDQELLPLLSASLHPYQNIKLLHADIMKISLLEEVQTFREKRGIPDAYPVKVVANLPYYITTPILMKLLEEEPFVEDITVMVQKEVGERICALPGSRDYGALSVACQVRCETEWLIDVPPESFRPRPKVDSCVIRLAKRQEYAVSPHDIKMFWNIVKAGFNQRRKRLANSLTNAGLCRKEEIEKVLEDLGLDVNIRAEKCSLQDFANLADGLDAGDR